MCSLSNGVSRHMCYLMDHVEKLVTAIPNISKVCYLPWSVTTPWFDSKLFKQNNILVLLWISILMKIIMEKKSRKKNNAFWPFLENHGIVPEACTCIEIGHYLSNTCRPMSKYKTESIKQVRFSERSNLYLWSETYLCPKSQTTCLSNNMDAFTFLCLLFYIYLKHDYLVSIFFGFMKASCKAL